MRRLTPGPLILATHNRGKLAEARALLAPHGLTLTSAADHHLPEPAEDGTTFADNARIKAHAAARATGLPALSDDSGIEIDALGGRPGIHTADWAETPEGRDFDVAMTRARDEMRAAGAPEPWIARFRCTLVLAWPDGHDELFEGEMPGRLVWPTRGPHGHGYDPMFQPEGFDLTFAEMPPETKNRISHRAKAMTAFVAGALGGSPDGRKA